MQTMNAEQHVGELWINCGFFPLSHMVEFANMHICKDFRRSSIF